MRWLLGLLVFYCAIVVLAPGGSIDRSDESVFLGYAHRIVHGRYASSGGVDADYLWYGPGLPGLLAPFVAIGLPVKLIRLLGPLLLVLGVFLLNRLLTMYVSERATFVGTAAFALYYPIYRVLPRLFSEPLAIACLLVAVCLGVRYVREGRRGFGAGAGVALAALAMTRLEYGWVLFGTLAVCALWWLFGRGTVARRGVAMMLVGVVLCVPWLVYTHHLTHKTLYWGNSGGLSLYWMASPFSKDLGEPHTVQDVFSNPNLVKNRTYFRRIERLDTIPHDTRLRKDAVKQIKKHPGRYAERLVFNFSRFWFRAPFSYQSFGLTALFYAIPGGLLLLSLVLAGVNFVRRRRSLPAELVPFVMVVTLGFLVHLAVAGYPRSIEPLVPIFILIAAIGLAAPSRDVARAPAATTTGRRPRRSRAAAAA